MSEAKDGGMERLFEFISNTADGVCAVDQSHRIVLWNAAAEDLFGLECREVIGKHCYEVIAGRDEQGCAVCWSDCVTMRQALEGDLVPTSDIRATKGEGRGIWLSVTTILLPSRWKELSVLVHLFRDTTRQKEMEHAARQFLATVTDEAAHGPPATGLPLAPGELTSREREVLGLLAGGASTDVIADRLYISSSTTRNHIQSILAKLGVHSRLEAVTVALRSGLV